MMASLACWERPRRKMSMTKSMTSGRIIRWFFLAHRVTWDSFASKIKRRFVPDGFHLMIIPNLEMIGLPPTARSNAG